MDDKTQTSHPTEQLGIRIVEDIPKEPSSSSEVSGWVWFLSAFALPLCSAIFYREASRRGTLPAILFLAAFATIIALVPTIVVATALREVVANMQLAYDSGEVPIITITNGIASVNAPEPAVIADEQGLFIAVDTTGQITTIDRSRYNTGILITRTELIGLQSSGRVQSYPLRDMQGFFGEDPLVIDKEWMSDLSTRFFGIFVLVMFFVLLIWYFAIRLGIAALFALAVWAILRIKWADLTYQAVLAIGLYALVPALYARFLLGAEGLSFCGLTSLFWIPAWALGLAAALFKGNPDSVWGQNRSLRPWRIVMVLPLLIYLLVVRFAPVGTWYLSLAVTLMTAGALALVGLIPLVTTRPKAPSV